MSQGGATFCAALCVLSQRRSTVIVNYSAS